MANFSRAATCRFFFPHDPTVHRRPTRRSRDPRETLGAAAAVPGTAPREQSAAMAGVAGVTDADKESKEKSGVSKFPVRVFQLNEHLLAFYDGRYPQNERYFSASTNWVDEGAMQL